MDEKEPPPPSGCLRILLSLPVLILVMGIEGPWRKFLLPLLPRNLSSDAVQIIYGLSVIAIAFVGWAVILKLADLAFGTTLYPYGSDPEAVPPVERAQFRRRGLLIMLAVIGADQLTKYAFGVARPLIENVGSSGLSPDAYAIMMCCGLVLFLFAWWRSQGELESLGFSLIDSSVASQVFDLVVRKRAVALPVHAFGWSSAPTLAEIAAIVGSVLYFVSWFWEPGGSNTTAVPPPK